MAGTPETCMGEAPALGIYRQPCSSSTGRPCTRARWRSDDWTCPPPPRHRSRGRFSNHKGEASVSAPAVCRAQLRVACTVVKSIRVVSRDERCGPPARPPARPLGSHCVRSRARLHAPLCCIPRFCLWREREGGCVWRACVRWMHACPPSAAAPPRGSRRRRPGRSSSRAALGAWWGAPRALVGCAACLGGVRRVPWWGAPRALVGCVACRLCWGGETGCICLELLFLELPCFSYWRVHGHWHVCMRVH